MLSNDKFNWETPNVIDPGEKPPLRPSRLHGAGGSDDDHFSGSYSSDTESRGSRESFHKPSARSFLSGNREKISLDMGGDGSDDRQGRFDWERQGSSMSLNDVEDAENGDDDDLQPPDNDDEDAEYGMPVSRNNSQFQQQSSFYRDSGADSQGHDQLPSVEQARLFAATILQESEHRNSRRHVFGKKMSGMFQKQNAETAPLSGFPSANLRTVNFADEQDDESLQRRRRCFRRIVWGIAILLAALLVFLGTGLLFDLIGQNNKDAGVSADTSIDTTNNDNNGNDAPSIPDTDASADSGDDETTAAARTQQLLDFLTARDVSDPASLTDNASPQFLAIQWLADADVDDIAIPAGADDSSAADRVLQRYIVAVLYYALGGSQWTKSLNFLSQDHECNWFETVEDENGVPYGFGVTCDRQLKIESILLPSNNLDGVVPAELYHLPLLKILNLKHNSVSGNFPEPPSEPSNVWSQLEYLDLKNNDLSGSIPESLLEKADQLQVLGLSHNQLTKKIPSAISNLSQLKTLALDFNLLTGDITTLQLSQTIEYLYLDHNILSGDMGVFLNDENDSSLLELDLSHNMFTSQSFPRHFFEDHQNLKILDLSGNSNLRGNLPNEALSIASSQLEYLSMRNNQFDGIVSNDFISKLTELQHLDLENNKLTGPMNAMLATACPKLRYLFMGQNEFLEGPIPSEYEQLKNLREISMDKTNRNGSLPAWINTSWTELRLLDLASNGLDGEIPDLSNLKELRFLMLQQNSLSSTAIAPTIGGDKLAVLALHQNANLQGNLDGDYCGNVDVITTDCATVQCTCCDTCCDANGCFSDYNFNRLEHEDGNWADKFERSDYSFDPQLLYKDDQGNNSGGGGN